MEFDSPDILLSDSESQFTSLVEQTGPIEAEHLRTLANAVARKSKLTDEKLVNHQDDELKFEGGENDPLIQ